MNVDEELFRLTSAEPLGCAYTEGSSNTRSARDTWLYNGINSGRGDTGRPQAATTAAAAARAPFAAAAGSRWDGPCEITPATATSYGVSHELESSTRGEGSAGTTSAESYNNNKNNNNNVNSAHQRRVTATSKAPVIQTRAARPRRGSSTSTAAGGTPRKSGGNRASSGSNRSDSAAHSWRGPSPVARHSAGGSDDCRRRLLVEESVSPSSSSAKQQRRPVAASSSHRRPSGTTLTPQPAAAYSPSAPAAAPAAALMGSPRSPAVTPRGKMRSRVQGNNAVQRGGPRVSGARSHSRGRGNGSFSMSALTTTITVSDEDEHSGVCVTLSPLTTGGELTDRRAAARSQSADAPRSAYLNNNNNNNNANKNKNNVNNSFFSDKVDSRDEPVPRTAIPQSHSNATRRTTATVVSASPSSTVSRPTTHSAAGGVRPYGQQRQRQQEPATTFPEVRLRPAAQSQAVDDYDDTSMSVLKRRAEAEVQRHAEEREHRRLEGSTYSYGSRRNSESQCSMPVVPPLPLAEITAQRERSNSVSAPPQQPSYVSASHNTTVVSHGQPQQQQQPSSYTAAERMTNVTVSTMSESSDHINNGPHSSAQQRSVPVDATVSDKGRRSSAQNPQQSTAASKHRSTKASGEQQADGTLRRKRRGFDTPPPEEPLPHAAKTDPNTSKKCCTVM